MSTDEKVCPYCGRGVVGYVCHACDLPAERLDIRTVSAWIIEAYRHGRFADERRYRHAFAELRARDAEIAEAEEFVCLGVEKLARQLAEANRG